MCNMEGACRLATRRFVANGMALGIATAVAACGSGSANGNPADATLAIKVGLVVPLTGDLGTFGPPLTKSAQLAAQELNGGLAQADASGTKVSLTSADEQTDPAAATSAARKVAGDGATCLIGPATSSDAIAVAQSVTSRQGLPQITPSATDAKITSLNDGGYVFRTAPSDALQGVALGQLVAQSIPTGGAVSLAARNDAYGEGFIRTVQSKLRGLGIKTQGPVLYDPSSSGFDSEAGKIVANSPAAYVIIDYPQTYQRMGAALLRTGKFDAHRLFTADGLAGDSIAALSKSIPTAALDGARGTRPGTPATGTALQAFLRRFAVSGGTKTHSPFDPQTFDATVLCGLAAIAAGSTDGAKVRDELTAVSAPPGAKYTFEQLPQAIKALRAGRDIDYQGVSGPIDFDKNGNPTAASYQQFSYRDGKLVAGATRQVAGR